VLDLAMTVLSKSKKTAQAELSTAERST